jgi:hypothetical protein
MGHRLGKIGVLLAVGKVIARGVEITSWRGADNKVRKNWTIQCFEGIGERRGSAAKRKCLQCLLHFADQ